jgi:Uma2 family endonuclease
MSLSIPHSGRLRGASQIVPLSVEQYDRMIDAGILPEGSPIELIDGMLVHKDRSKAGEDIMTVGKEQIWAVKALARIDERLRPLGYHMQTQAPIIVSTLGEPEPDGAVLTGSMDDFLEQKPGAAAVMCVIEVADSSLNFDRTTKLSAYAEAGIQQYVIINLVDRVLEESTFPQPAEGRYASERILRANEALSLFLRGEERLSVNVRDWLPPRS